jgi:hypothetical protein
MIKLLPDYSLKVDQVRYYIHAASRWFMEGCHGLADAGCRSAPLTPNRANSGALSVIFAAGGCRDWKDLPWTKHVF